MQRREFIGALAGGAFAVSLPTRLLGAEKVPHIGFLGGNRGGLSAAGLTKGFEELGYLDGKNIKIEWRFDNGHPELLPEMAADLLRMNVDVIVALSSSGGHIAQKATTVIPIVALSSHDGVGSGLYRSLARPEGNITGIESMAPELDVKRVEMMKSILPQLSRLTVLQNPIFPGAKLHSDDILKSAEKLKIAVRFVNVSAISDFDRAFAEILNAPPDAMLTVLDPMIFSQFKLIIDFGNKHRIPMIHESKLFVSNGALISYGPDLFDLGRRAASQVEKILKGTKAGDIPVEQPTNFDLAINLKTAKALGITFPNDLIVGANVVIE